MLLSYESNISDYDVDLQIDEAAMTQSLDPCFPDTQGQVSYKSFHRRPIKHIGRHKLKRGTTRPMG